MQTLAVPQGAFALARYPQRANDPLRAWDAADEYLLHHLHAAGLPAPESSVLILNDSCGALAVALAAHRPQSLSDSHLAHRAALANAHYNHLDLGNLRLLTSLDDPTGPFDLVLCKIPKTLALLQDQLHRIRPYCHPHTRFVGAGMVRSIHSSTLELCERSIGPTHTSLASKKARLVFCTYDADLDPGPSPYPTNYVLEGTDYTLINHANLFSRERLDIGTRLFLEQIPSSDAPLHIADLGCGNGVIGLVAAARNPSAELYFADESFMAIASARANFSAAFPGRAATFAITDGLADRPKNSLDLVLCNPPCHQQRAVDDATSQRMFRQARTALKKGGTLWIVGNRHLGYHSKLKRLFGHCTTIASNRRFIMLKATKH